MNELMRKYCKGVTLTELIIVILIFSLFMLGLYATLDVGMKSWQMGETKSDFFQKAQVTLGSIVRDFSTSTWMSSQIDNDGDPAKLNEYICFETPIDYTNGLFHLESKTSKTVWEGYIIYYIYPRINTNPTATKRDLYRKFKPRTTKNSSPLLLQNLTSFIDTTTKNTDESLRTVAKDIYSINFVQKQTNLVITVTFKGNIREHAHVMFSPGGNSTKGVELIELKTSVIPKN
jgi:prepilin-type N-terminal cleavage/methylation domain-containing protein